MGSSFEGVVRVEYGCVTGSVKVDRWWKYSNILGKYVKPFQKLKSKFFLNPFEHFKQVTAMKIIKIIKTPKPNDTKFTKKSSGWEKSKLYFRQQTFRYVFHASFFKFCLLVPFCVCVYAYSACTEFWW